jgi:rhodanese-related sulfurtransferase
MPAFNAIAPDKLIRLIGTPGCPLIIDLRPDEKLSGSGGLMPASVRRSASEVSRWAPSLEGRSVIVVCQDGKDVSPGVAAWLRHSGVSAEMLEGGADGWREGGYPLVPQSKLSRSGAEGNSMWVTRARPKVDRIACPWLIRRFIDPAAVFLFVAPNEIPSVVDRFGATPFDVDGVFWSHRGELCTFDTMVEEFQLGWFKALLSLAVIVRGADTAHPEIAPQAAGLLAASLGLSRMYSDDLEQLEAGMLLYDAFYRWCRDATDEIHDWVSHQPSRRAK